MMIIIIIIKSKDNVWTRFNARAPLAPRLCLPLAEGSFVLFAENPSLYSEYIQLKQIRENLKSLNTI